MNGQINSDILKREYYSATKRNKLPMHAMAWMDLKGIMFSE